MHAGQHLLRRTSVGCPRRRAFARRDRSRGRLVFPLESRGNDRHDQVIADLGIDHLSDDDVRLSIRRVLYDRGRFFHFMQRHVWTTRDIQQYATRTFDTALFQERAANRLVRRILRPVGAPPDSHAHDRPPRVGHDGPHIGKVDVHQSDGCDHIGDTLNGLTQDIVRHLERIQQWSGLVDDAQQPLVRNNQQRINVPAEANIIVGQVINPEIGDDLIVTVIATGFEREEAPAARPVTPERNTARTPNGRPTQQVLTGVHASGSDRPHKDLDRPTFLRRMGEQREAVERVAVVGDDEWDVPTFLRKQAD